MVQQRTTHQCTSSNPTVPYHPHTPQPDRMTAYLVVSRLAMWSGRWLSWNTNATATTMLSILSGTACAQGTLLDGKASTPHPHGRPTRICNSMVLVTQFNNQHSVWLYTWNSTPKMQPSTITFMTISPGLWYSQSHQDTSRCKTRAHCGTAPRWRGQASL